MIACSAMCPEYLQRPVPHRQLARLLNVQRGFGTQFSSILNLRQLDIDVSYQQYGTLEDLYQLLDKGLPPIVSVQTGELPYWNSVNVYHVIV
ncbi:MAG: hypothetical protein KDE53_02545, partial [Caldilineaceae bacterium]|nr:hypothetical protein [Caldilineaceae bacterium]